MLPVSQTISAAFTICGAPVNRRRLRRDEGRLWIYCSLR